MIFVISFICLLVCLASYFLALRPYLQILSLKIRFQRQGYKVKIDKLNFLKQSTLAKAYYWENVNNDAFGFLKSEYQGYDVILTNSFNMVHVILCSAQLLKDSFKQNHEIQKNELNIDNFDRFYGGGLLMKEGKQWKTKRKLYSEIFNFNVLTDIFPLIESSVGKCLNQQIKDGIEINVLTKFQNMFFNSFVNAYVGSEFPDFSYKGMSYAEANVSAFGSIYRQSFYMRHAFLGNSFIKKGFLKQDREIDQIVKVVCQETRKQIKNKYVKFLEQKGQNSKERTIISKIFEKTDFSRISDEQKQIVINGLTGDMLIFFFASTDTTSSTLTILLRMLQDNPEVKKRLTEEIESFKGMELNATNLKQFEYMDAVLNETLRMYGPANTLFIRQIKKNPVRIGNVELYKNNLLFMQALTVHFDQQYYQKPFEFNPDRWMQKNNENIDPYSFVPFSAGQRNCIGQHLARIEIKLTLAKLLKQWDFQFTENLKMGIPFVYCSVQNKLIFKKKNS